VTTGLALCAMSNTDSVPLVGCSGPAKGKA
jgi:hypothetical protein